MITVLINKTKRVVGILILIKYTRAATLDLYEDHFVRDV